MKYTRFVIYKNLQGEFYFRLFNARDTLLLTGRTYTLRIACIAAIHNLYTIVLRDEYYKVFGEPGAYNFRLVNQDQEPVARSEEFRSFTNLSHGIHAVKKNVCIAVIEDYSANVRYIMRNAGGQV